MTDFIYLGAVVVGATTLLIEAFRNFNAQTGNHPFSLHPILKEVEVRNLCTTGEVIAGFSFYAGLYLVVYAVVLGSAEVYELLLSASNARNEIGATDNALTLASDPSLLSSKGYGKPIFVSALLISFLSIGAVKPIEATMRSLAHRLAGIPRGVYKVIESLRGVPYEDFMNDQPGLLVRKFREAVAPIGQDRSFAEKQKAIESTLAAIDYLSAATGADDRAIYFPLYQMAELTALSKKLDEELEGIHKAIDQLGEQLLSTGEDGTQALDTRGKWDALSNLARAAAIARSNTMAVFAVLFVRNNRSVFNQSGMLTRKSFKTFVPRSPIEKTTKYIQENYNAEQNAFAISLIVALILSAIGTFLVYEQWLSWKVDSDPIVYSEQARALDREINEPGSKPVCISNINDCKKAEAIRRYALSQRPTNISEAVWDTIHSGLVLFLSVFFVLVAREVRIEQQSWQTNWKFYQFPFLRLLGMSLLSGLVAVFASASVKLAQLAWNTGFRPTQTQIIFLFQQSGTFFALHFGAGLILSFAALVIMDKHRHLSIFWTLSISIIFCVMYGLYMWLLVFLTYEGALPASPKEALFSQAVRDALIFTSMPFFFLILFAIMLEISEAGDIKIDANPHAEGADR